MFGLNVYKSQFDALNTLFYLRRLQVSRRVIGIHRGGPGGGGVFGVFKPRTKLKFRRYWWSPRTH